MKTKQAKPAETFVDPDDAPAWTKDQFERAEFAIGGEVIRPAQGTLTKRGRPRVEAPKQIVSLRLEPDVIEAFRATGAGWQLRMGEVLRQSPIARAALSLKRPEKATRTLKEKQADKAPGIARAKR